jgi:hypothetical protein
MTRGQRWQQFAAHVLRSVRLTPRQAKRLARFLAGAPRVARLASTALVLVALMALTGGATTAPLTAAERAERDAPIDWSKHSPGSETAAEIAEREREAREVGEQAERLQPAYEQQQLPQPQPGPSAAEALSTILHLFFGGGAPPADAQTRALEDIAAQLKAQRLQMEREHRLRQLDRPVQHSPMPMSCTSRTFMGTVYTTCH